VRKRLVAGLLVLGLCAAASAGERVADGVEITVDGETRRVAVVSVEGGLEVTETDLVPVGEFVLTRGHETPLTFRTEPGRLWQKFADGRERVVAAVAAALRPGEKPDESVRIGSTTYEGVKPRRDTFEGLGDADIAALRGVMVVNWSETVAAEVEKVDAARACFVVRVCKEDPLPPLPAAACFVVLAGYPHDHESAPSNLAPLARLSDLRLLKLGSHHGGATDLAPLAALKELRWLDLDFRDVEHPEALAKLTSLRVLDVTGCDTLEDAEFLRPLSRLVKVNVGHTKIADLSPLSGREELREIDADLSKVCVLPGGELPALREFRLLSVPAPRSAIAAFAKAHPQCDIVYGWRGLLVKAAENVDRVRIRSGGTCHRRRSEEALLLELKARADIDDLLGTLRFDDTASGDRCMCCGDPTFEFYEGEKLVISLGYHHGRTLRWPGGPWPGDACLEPEASAVLCEWLAKRGATGPRDEVESEKRRRADLAARDAEQQELLGKERIAAIAGAADTRAVAKLLAEWFPDRDARLDLLVRLGSRAERGGSGLGDSVVSAVKATFLSEEDAAAVLELLAARIAAGGERAQVAADYVNSLRDDRFDPVALAKLRLDAAKFLISAGVLDKAVRILDDAKSKAGDELLLSLLPPADERGDPLEPVTSLHLEVVFALVERCDASLLPRLRAISVQAPGSAGYGNAAERFDRCVARRPPPDAK
jgi:hypothetical protein